MVSDVSRDSRPDEKNEKNYNFRTDYLDIIQYLYEDLYIEYDINILNLDDNLKTLDDVISSEREHKLFLNSQINKFIVKKTNKTMKYLSDMKIYSKYRKYYFKNRWIFLYSFNL